MQTLTIEAVSLESARGFLAALSGFDVELIEDGNGVYRVRLVLGQGNQQVIDALNAIHSCVAKRGDGPASVELDGKKYIIDPEPDAG